MKKLEVKMSWSQRCWHRSTDRTLDLNAPDAGRLRPVALTWSVAVLESDRTLVLRPIAFDRTRPVMSGTLLEMTERWRLSVRSVEAAAFGHQMTVEIG